MSFEKQVETFIKDRKVVASSKHQTKNAIIYWAYLKWKSVDYKYGTPMHRTTFFKYFSKHFKSGMRKRHRHYWVESPHFLLNVIEREDALSEARRENAWRRRKAKRKVKEIKNRIQD